jgi:glucose/arabinose dehydrogenase
VLLEIDQPAPNHNGGNILTGPDGYQWIGMGDGGGADDQFGTAQDPTELLGSMLRIDGTGPTDALVPVDNPCVARPDECRPEVVAIGLRNPWRFSFDPGTGDLWVADVGQGTWEEIDVVRAGELGPVLNFGWPDFEGTHAYLGDGDLTGPVVAPIHEYSHDEGGCSITGGVVYRGGAIPALAGTYIYGDYCVSHLLGLTGADTDTPTPVDLGLDVPGGQLASFATDAAGEVYVVSLAGGLYRLDGR